MYFMKNRKLLLVALSAFVIALLSVVIIVIRVGFSSDKATLEEWDIAFLGRLDLSNFTKAEKIAKIHQLLQSSGFEFRKQDEGASKTVCATDGCLDQTLDFIDSMDFSVDPCDDFYNFACGKWYNGNDTALRISWNKWTILNQRKRLMMKRLLISPNALNDTLPLRQAHAFYKSCVTFALTEKPCLQPILDVLGIYGGMPTLTPSWNPASFNISRTIGSFLGKFSLASILKSSLTLSESHTSKVLLQGPKMRIDKETRLSNFWTRQLFMGVMKEMGRSLKLKLNSSFLQREYNEMKIFEENLIILQPQNESEKDENENHSKNLADWLVHDKLEALLEENSKHMNVTLEEYLKSVTSELPATGPRIPSLLKVITLIRLIKTTKILQLASFFTLNWKVVLEEQFADSDVKLRLDDDILVSRTFNLTLLESLILERGPRTVSNYLMWRLIRHLLPYTTFVMGYQRVGETYPSGECLKPNTEAIFQHFRTQKCLGIALNKFENALDYSLFKDLLGFRVNKYDAQDLAQNIKRALADQVYEAKWISEATRMEALEKIQRMIHNIAYPDPDKDYIFNEAHLNRVYKKLTIHADAKDYFQNILNLKSWEARINLEQLRVPIQRNTWIISPTSPTASHVYSQNAITIPAGILASSFFSPTGLQSANYGSIGFIIGHEISHGFEAGGINYSANGSRQSWWTEEDTVKFKDTAKCFITQYNAIKTPFGNINGMQTLNENIADNAGLDAAWRAYNNSMLSNNYKERDIRLFGLEALKPEQIFFLSFASTFCSSETPEGLKQYLNEDEHTPLRYRILAVLQNSEAFSQAWNCKPGTRMNPEKKCKFW